jgi:hypothetical protein
VSIRGWRPSPLIGLVLVFALLLLCMRLACFDVWWHLQHGRWIVENGRVPRVDLFTYGSLGEPYLDQHWGFQILCWAVYALGGVPLLVLANAAIGTTAVGAAIASRSQGVPPSLVALAWILPIHVLAARSFVRPEQITLVAIAITLWILRASIQRPRLLLILPVIQVFAINCHAVAITNVAVIGAFVVHRAWLRWRGPAQPLAGPSGKLESSVLAASALAGLASPYGLAGFLLPVTLLREISVDREFWSHLSNELLSPLVYLNAEGLNFFVVAFFAQVGIGALSFLLLPRGRRFDPYRVLLFAGFTYLALSAQRNINLFAVVVGAVTMWNVADGVSSRPRWQAWFKSPRTTRAVGVVLVALIVSVVTGEWYRVTGSPREFGLGEQANLYIHGPARFAARDGMPRRAFVVGFAQGAVYEFHNAPERLSYMDGRLEHRRRSTIVGFMDVKERLADRAAMARADRSMLAVIAPEATSPEEWPAIILDPQWAGPQITGLLANPEWRIVFADRTGAVFVSRRLADQLALPAASLAPLYGG